MEYDGIVYIFKLSVTVNPEEWETFKNLSQQSPTQKTYFDFEDLFT